jgi:hypothetical protein
MLLFICNVPGGEGVKGRQGPVLRSLEWRADGRVIRIWSGERVECTQTTELKRCPDNHDLASRDARAAADLGLFQKKR